MKNDPPIHLKGPNVFSSWAIAIQFHDFINVSFLHMLTRNQICWWNNDFEKKKSHKVNTVTFLLCSSLGWIFTHGVHMTVSLWKSLLNSHPRCTHDSFTMEESVEFSPTVYTWQFRRGRVCWILTHGVHLTVSLWKSLLNSHPRCTHDSFAMEESVEFSPTVYTWQFHYGRVCWILTHGVHLTVSLWKSLLDSHPRCTLDSFTMEESDEFSPTVHVL